MPNALLLALALTTALARQAMKATVPSALKLTPVLRRMHTVDALWHWMEHQKASLPRRIVLRQAQVRISADARMDTPEMAELAQKSRTVRVPAVETVINMLLASTRAQDRTNVIAKLVIPGMEHIANPLIPVSCRNKAMPLRVQLSAASNAKLASHVVIAVLAKILLVGNLLVALVLQV